MTIKKLIISTLVSITLTACSSGVSNETPVQAGHNVQNICIKGNVNTTPEHFLLALTNSLNNKGISIKKQVENDYNDCEYLMVFKAKGNQKILAAAKFNVIDLKQDKKSIGSVAYNRRGDEKDRVKEVGLQGQIDMMINTLFKYY